MGTDGNNNDNNNNNSKPSDEQVTSSLSADQHPHVTHGKGRGVYPVGRPLSGGPAHPDYEWKSVIIIIITQLEEASCF